MWKIMTAILGLIIVALIVALVLFLGNSSNKIKSLEDEKSNLKDSLTKQYEKEIVGLKDENTKLNQQRESDIKKVKDELTAQYENTITGLKDENNKSTQKNEGKIKEISDENIKLAKALSDPTKRIPKLMERTEILAKEVISFYQEKDISFLAKLSAVKEEYNKGRNDPEIFINVKKCLEAKESFRGSTEEYKGFSKLYLEFLADKQPELTASGIEIDSIKTNIQKNLSNNADNLSGMEKEMALIQEADIQVYADKGWQNAGVTVNIDDTVYVVANGEWAIRTGGPKFGADGETQAIKEYAVKGFEPIKLGALICKLTGESDYNLKQCGKKFSFTGPVKTGQLSFTVNDIDRDNNHGALNVKVIVVKKQ